MPLMKLMASALPFPFPFVSLVVVAFETSASRAAIPDGYSLANSLPALKSSLLSTSGDWIMFANSVMQSSPYEETCVSKTSQQTAVEMTPSVKDLEAVVQDRQGMMDTGWSYEAPAKAAFCLIKLTICCCRHELQYSHGRPLIYRSHLKARIRSVCTNWKERYIPK